MGANENGFDWEGDEPVIQHQKETTVYYNPRGHVVIRQREDDGDDHVVIIQPMFVQALIDALVAHRDGALEESQ